MPTVVRRFLLWTVVCCVSAAPSFVIARNGFDQSAMILAVGLFIVMYTAATSTERFERFHHLPFVRRTLYIGYGMRMLLSVVFPVGFAADLWPGFASVSVVKAMGFEVEKFWGTFLTTCVQGTILNVILFAFMSAVYGFQRAFMKPPEEAQPRGFEVLMPVAAQPVVSGAQPVVPPATKL